MSAFAGPKPARKFPPPCWTRDEALVLIEAYRERWYALHRAFLKTPDWDAVAEKVISSFPDVTPPKTSAQCRHKIEKLRQRHRVEKQRAADYAGDRFFSSWFYFEAMEAMENGSVSEPGDHNQGNLQTQNPNGLNPGRGIRIKPLQVEKPVTLHTKRMMKQNPNFVSRISNRYNDGSLVEAPIQETLNSGGYKGKEFRNHKDGYLVETQISEVNKNRKSSGIRGGVTIEPSGSQESGRPGLRPRKFSKVVCDDEDDDNDEMWVKIPWNGSRGKYRNAENLGPNVKDLNKGKRKSNDGIPDVVSSIRLLGDGFMKVEMMKIDMAREIEKMRMESDMKRSELILESQKQIVDAFVKGVIESKKQPSTLAHV